VGVTDGFTVVAAGAVVPAGGTVVVVVVGSAPAQADRARLAASVTDRNKWVLFMLLLSNLHQVYRTLMTLR
jgi:hypothetical protein